MNLEENQGFLGHFFAVFDPDSSPMLHMEVPPRCQLNAQSWKNTKLSKFFKLVQITKLGLFSVYGVGPVSECGLVYCLL